MTRPRFVDDGVCGYSYRSDAAMTDWNTFLTNINTELVTNNGWTTPSANLYKSRVDAGGRWIDLLFTRVSATNLEIRMRDHLGRTVYTRRVQLAAGGTTIEYFTGWYYCVVQSLQATAELLQAYILEPSPDTELMLYNVGILGTAYRTTADANDSQGSQVMMAFGLIDTTQVYSFASRMAPGSSTTANTGLNKIMVSGSIVTEPIIPDVGTVTASTCKSQGQVFQAWGVDNGRAFGTDLTIKVDTGVTATFRVLSIPVATNGTTRMAMRKA